MQIRGAAGAIVSTMNTAEHTYMVLVNKDLSKALTVEMQYRQGVTEITKDLKEKSVKGKYKVSPGDILILKLN